MNGDDFASLAYLVLLGLAILSGVFAMYRGRLGKGVQDAMIWGLIFLGVVALYGLKDPIERGLFPQRTMSAEADRIVLNRQRDGHFHADAEVNGTPVTFIVDTGASGIVLSRRDAERIGLDFDTLRFIGSAQTANGTVRLAPVRLDSIAIGEVREDGIRAAVNEGALDISLLGMDYLDRFGRVIVEGDRMILER